MSTIVRLPTSFLLAAPIIALASSSLAAQQQPDAPNTIVVTGERDHQPTGPGPEIKGVITARHADKLKVTAPDGTSTIISLANDTRIKASSGLFGGGSKLGPDALLNGLPVTVKTLQSADGLVASEVTFRNGDFKTATMIHNGTAQGFEEQTAATAALRGRLGDIDKYNIKSTTNVYFDTGKATLSPGAKTELCQAATAAEANENALLLVVGYTDSVGSDELNQALSEKRAGAVINYLQQACHWKPYRVLTPTGMAKADPLASNDTPQGKAQNRRVAVNVLVSKSVDGM
ncbi:OmpA family protein [Sphingomonas sp. GlSt437]|uniref:OmpA family protein n=1 Tax=Sphingomonas sp. GlSt437 TaxID=3389970 RepID=UPI003A8A9BBE